MNQVEQNNLYLGCLSSKETTLVQDQFDKIIHTHSVQFKAEDASLRKLLL